MDKDDEPPDTGAGPLPASASVDGSMKGLVGECRVTCDV